MKKFLYSILLLLQFSFLQTNWVVVKIDNRSDSAFMKAARNNNVEISSISQSLKKPCSKDGFIHLDARALFGSSGRCKIITQTPLGEQVHISFLGDPRHRVANGRTRYSDIDSRNAAAALTQPMMARVFATKGNDVKLIGYAGYDNHNGSDDDDDNDDQQFELQLIGSNGVYETVLVPVNH